MVKSNENRLSRSITDNLEINSQHSGLSKDKQAHKHIWLVLSGELGLLEGPYLEQIM